MNTARDPKAPKKATNLSIDADLLRMAREQDINLSATLEQALVAALRERRREQWLADNLLAIAAYNEFVEERGVFSDRARSF